jgi:hypothetical protein
LLALLPLLALAFVFASPNAEAQASGTVSIDIDYPPLVILWYYSDLNINIPTASLAGVMIGGTGDTAVPDATAPTLTWGAGLTADAGMTAGDAPISVGDLTSVALTITNVWAVRSVGPATATTDVSADFSGGTDNATLTGPGTDTITINSIAANPNSFSPTGFGGIQVGALEFDLDLSSADTSGAYTGGQFTITAENI